MRCLCLKRAARKWENQPSRRPPIYGPPNRNWKLRFQVSTQLPVRKTTGQIDKDTMNNRISNDEWRIKEFFLFYFWKSRAKRHPQFVNRKSAFVIWYLSASGGCWVSLFGLAESHTRPYLHVEFSYECSDFKILRLASLTPLAQTYPCMSLEDKKVMRSLATNGESPSYCTRAGRNPTPETYINYKCACCPSGTPFLSVVSEKA